MRYEFKLGFRIKLKRVSLKVFVQKRCSRVRHLVVDKLAGRRKGADLLFPREERVRLVRFESHCELAGEESGDSTIEYS